MSEKLISEIYVELYHSVKTSFLLRLKDIKTRMEVEMSINGNSIRLVFDSEDTENYESEEAKQKKILSSEQFKTFLAFFTTKKQFYCIDDFYRAVTVRYNIDYQLDDPSKSYLNLVTLMCLKKRSYSWETALRGTCLSLNTEQFLYLIEERRIDRVHSAYQLYLSSSLKDLAILSHFFNRLNDSEQPNGLAMMTWKKTPHILHRAAEDFYPDILTCECSCIFSDQAGREHEGISYHDVVQVPPSTIEIDPRYKITNQFKKIEKFKVDIKLKNPNNYHILLQLDQTIKQSDTLSPAVKGNLHVDSLSVLIPLTDASTASLIKFNETIQALSKCLFSVINDPALPPPSLAQLLRPNRLKRVVQYGKNRLKS